VTNTVVTALCTKRREKKESDWCVTEISRLQIRLW
jgi:hypothetical protein